jgi:hypothetical protein
VSKAGGWEFGPVRGGASEYARCDYLLRERRRIGMPFGDFFTAGLKPRPSTTAVGLAEIWFGPGRVGARLLRLISQARFAGAPGALFVCSGPIHRNLSLTKNLKCKWKKARGLGRVSNNSVHARPVEVPYT